MQKPRGARGGMVTGQIGTCVMAEEDVIRHKKPSVSVNSNWVHPPEQTPGISSKNLPGGRDLTFESCPGAENSTRTVILWKMKVSLKKVAWIKFLQVKTKNKPNF